MSSLALFITALVMLMATVAFAATDNRPTTGQNEEDQSDNEPCEVARLKCAYRVGCGMALQNYMVGCSDVITGSSKRCSDHCRNSLIALTSTEEGETLMKCKCGDSFCQDSKNRIDICRSAVLRAQNSTTVSCSVAQWICLADPLCSTALDYYNRFCRSMFSGKKCTLRCKNSISILRRQEKAAKLSTCVCDGSEDYDCPSILDNMDRLCFRKGRLSSTVSPSGEDNRPGVEVGKESSDHQAPGRHHPIDIDTNDIEITRPIHLPSSGHSFVAVSGSLVPLLIALFCCVFTADF